MLTLDNIQIDLGGQTIVENFSLHLAAGECLALSGASGCGKTTILRAIAGLVELEDGSIRCHARRLACSKTPFLSAMAEVKEPFR